MFLCSVELIRLCNEYLDIFMVLEQLYFVVDSKYWKQIPKVILASQNSSSNLSILNFGIPFSLAVKNTMLHDSNFEDYKTWIKNCLKSWQYNNFEMSILFLWN